MIVQLALRTYRKIFVLILILFKHSLVHNGPTVIMFDANLFGFCWINKPKDVEQTGSYMINMI